MNDVVTITSVLLTIAVVCWPRWGLWSRWRDARRLAARTRREDALKHILKSEVNAEGASVLSVAGALRIGDGEAASLLRDLESHGLVRFDEGRLRLRRPGRELALHVVRAHRLWESYLADQTGVDETRWHRLAERQEHLLSPQQAKELEAQLGNPLHDPHGDLIPETGGELTADEGHSVNTIQPDRPFTIVHIEDEPENVYAEISRQGLRSGMRAYVISKTPQLLRLWAEGRIHELAPSVAQNLSVAELEGTSCGQLLEERYLHDLGLGERGRVLALSSACRGAERRRLLDLGFVPGSVVEASLVSPGGDPTAYSVRGSLVALRRQQAGLIRIEPLREEAA